MIIIFSNIMRVSSITSSILVGKKKSGTLKFSILYVKIVKKKIYKKIQYNTTTNVQSLIYFQLPDCLITKTCRRSFFLFTRSPISLSSSNLLSPLLLSSPNPPSSSLFLPPILFSILHDLIFFLFFRFQVCLELPAARFTGQHHNSEQFSP